MSTSTSQNYLSHLQRVLRVRGVPHEQAEDLAQEAVLRFHVYTRGGGEVGRPEAFVMRTAINLAINAHRNAHLDRYLQEPIEKLELVDEQPAPEEILAANQRLTRYRQALDRVSQRTREVFFMHRIEGWTQGEIARRFGISVSAIEKHIANAMTVLCVERQRE